MTPSNRRIWVPLTDIPDHVQKAFVTAEDKRFYQHKGVDERGLIRAFITNLAQPGRPQGGSTITQQVAKNLLVGDDVTYERKIREMIVASRLERLLGKPRDPRTLSQLDLSRPRLVGHRDGGAQLFRQTGQGTVAGRRRAARRPYQGPQLLQSRAPRGPRPGTARLCARPHAGRRRHQRRPGEICARKAAAPRRLRAPAPRYRLLLSRSDRARGEIAGRHRFARRRFLRRPFHHSIRTAEGCRNGAAGRPGALRAQHRPHAVRRARGQSRRGHRAPR